jgi:hypothetical protein
MYGDAAEGPFEGGKRCLSVRLRVLLEKKITGSKSGTAAGLRYQAMLP